MSEPKSPAQAPVQRDQVLTEPRAPQPPEQLTPEEQMARFEKELKENDWGHQPC